MQIWRTEAVFVTGSCKNKGKVRRHHHINVMDTFSIVSCLYWEIIFTTFITVEILNSVIPYWILHIGAKY